MTQQVRVDEKGNVVFNTSTPVTINIPGADYNLKCTQKEIKLEKKEK